MIEVSKKKPRLWSTHCIPPRPSSTVVGAFVSKGSTSLPKSSKGGGCGRNTKDCFHSLSSCSGSDRSIGLDSVSDMLRQFWVPTSRYLRCDDEEEDFNSKSVFSAYSVFFDSDPACKEPLTMRISLLSAKLAPLSCGFIELSVSFSNKTSQYCVYHLSHVMAASINNYETATVTHAY